MAESSTEVGTVHHKGRAEQVIETVASGLGNAVAWMAEHGVLFAIFAVVWIAFGFGLFLGQGSLDQAWQTIGEQPLIVQFVVWVLFLPVMIGLWVWETAWPLVIRLVLVLGICGWNLLVLLPHREPATES